MHMKKDERDHMFPKTPLMPPQDQQQYYEMHKPQSPTSVRTNPNRPPLRQGLVAVPTRERKPSNKPVRPYVLQDTNPLDFSFRPSSSDNNNKVATKKPYNNKSTPPPQPTRPPQHHKEPFAVAAANYNEPSASVDSGANARQKVKKRKTEQAEKELFLTKDLPRIRFFAVSSSHQLSAENAIIERPRAYEGH